MHTYIRLPSPIYEMVELATTITPEYGAGTGMIREASLSTVVCQGPIHTYIHTLKFILHTYF